MGGGGDASRLLGELVGTAFLFVTLSLAGHGAAAYAGAALLVALKWACGGTFNPAVTIADFIIQDLDIKDALLITAAQCGGAAIGSVACAHALHGGMPSVPGEGNTQLMVEALFTCMVCLGISASMEGNDLAYGAAFLAACVAGGGVCFNPAIVVGVCLSGTIPWKVIVAEIVGAILAGLIRHVIKGSKNAAEKMIAEFIAAFFLTAVAFKSTDPLATAACLTFAVCALGATGNGVCASANFFSKKVNLGDTGVILIGQFAGAACAALAMKHLGGGSLTLAGGHVGSVSAKSVAECLFSAVLGMVTVGSEKIDINHGLAISLAWFAGSCAAAAASHGILNPAVALGACIQDMSFGPFAYYAPCEIVGGMLGALCMHAVKDTGFGVQAREVAVQEEEQSEEYHTMM